MVMAITFFILRVAMYGWLIYRCAVLLPQQEPALPWDSIMLFAVSNVLG